MQLLYDNNVMEPQLDAPKVVRKVLESALKRRQTLGNSQTCIERGKESLQQKGIIYCIVNTQCRKVYIGQSMNSAAHRFKQHYHACWNPNSRDLQMYPSWRRHGIDNVFIFPLEKVVVDPGWSQLDNNSRKRLFQNRAYVLEADWVRRLRSWAPHGYNVQFGGKRKKCRHAKHNPMAKKTRNLPSATPGIGRQFAYRDWKRRIKYLVGTLASNRWSTKQVNKYKKSNLGKMIRVMQQLVDSQDYLEYPADQFTEVLRRLRICKKIPLPRVSSRRKLENPLVFRVLWHTSMLEGVPLMRILKEAGGWPEELAAAKDRLIIAKKLHRTLGDRICNYRKIAKNVEDRVEFDDWNKCPCRSLFHGRYRPKGGCVITMNTSIAGCATLTNLLDEGARFRENVEVNHQSLLRGAVAEFVERASKELQVDRSAFDLWKENVLTATLKQLPPPKVGLRSILDRPTVNHRLKYLQKHLVIVITDKAAKNFSFICRNYYLKVLNDELSSVEGAYQDCHLSMTNIFDDYYGMLYY